MRFLLTNLFFLILGACTDKENKNIGTSSIPKEYLTPLLDSFNTRNLDLVSSLQYDISLDTIDIEGDSKHPRIYAVIPNLSNEYYPSFQKEIDKLINAKKTDFYETIRGNKEYQNSNWQNRLWDILIQPVSLYQTDRVISFALETNREYKGMSTGFEYDIMNYDLENKKPIALQDYFILNTSADTSFFRTNNWPCCRHRF